MAGMARRSQICLEVTMRFPNPGFTQFALLLGAFCMTLDTFAQVPAMPSARTPLSVERLVALTLARNTELMAARQRMAETQGLLRQAGLRPNPSLDISASNGDAVNSAGESEYSITYSHTFELGGKRDRRIAVAQRTLELANRDIENRERLLSADVRTKYADALAAMQKLKHAEELFQLTSQNAELAKVRAETGEAAPLEHGLLQVELNRISSDRMLFAGQLEQALLQIKLLAGAPLDETLPLSGSLEKAIILPELNSSIEIALSRRADLKAALINEQLADAELELARSAATPDLVARGGYARARSQFDQFGFSRPGGPLVPLRDEDNIISGGVSIVLPFANRNQGNVQAAIARKNAAVLMRASLERIVRQEVMAAVSRLAAVQKALQLFDAGVIGQSRENLRIVRGAYELGELRLLDVINEQRRLIEIQRAHTDLLRDAYVAGVELERAIGVQAK